MTQNTNREKIARDFYDQMPLNEEWRLLGPELEKDVRLSRGARQNVTNLHDFQVAMAKHRLFATKVFASEIFPDQKPPRIVVATSELQDHKGIRKESENGLKRLSGEAVTMDNELWFMRLDAISLRDNLIGVSTKAPCKKVAEILLQNGYVPVDAHFELIPASKISPF